MTAACRAWPALALMVAALAMPLSLVPTFFIISLFGIFRSPT